MIAVNTQQLMDMAARLAEAADTLDAEGQALEDQLRALREEQRVLWVFHRSTQDIEILARQRAETVAGMRAQGLYLRECAKRYRAAQSRAFARDEKLQ